MWQCTSLFKDYSRIFNDTPIINITLLDTHVINSIDIDNIINDSK
jgi:hypothetical protein